MHHPKPRQPKAPSRLFRGLLWFALGLLVWAACTGFEPADRIAALPAALFFAWLGVRLVPAHERIRLHAIPGFAIYFLYQSIRAGIHVAFLALHPLRDVSPHWMELRSDLPAGAPQALFAILVSLLPGTLCGEIENDIHHIHLLTATTAPEKELRELERWVGQLFGVTTEGRA